MVVTTEVVVDNQMLEGVKELGSLIPLALFGLGLVLSKPLFSGFARHAACTRARSDCKAVTCEPGLEDATDDLQSVGLDNTTPDEFAPPATGVDDALKGEGKLVGGLLVGRLWIKTRSRFGWMGTGKG